MNKVLSLLLVMGVMSGCSTISKLTVKEYTNSSGQKVTAGRYKPEADNQCQLRRKMASSWGFEGRMDPDKRFEEIAMTAVEKAAGLKANYIYIVVPSGDSDGGVDKNNSYADIYYYYCKNPPG
ncbi:MAG: hypothetical protein GC149_13435 [Gammaproteobacteria bacterium]|nr:hypothetical protein [Gammaproteobacteria bacterium]